MGTQRACTRTYTLHTHARARTHMYPHTCARSHILLFSLIQRAHPTAEDVTTTGRAVVTTGSVLVNTSTMQSTTLVSVRYSSLQTLVFKYYRDVVSYSNTIGMLCIIVQYIDCSLCVRVPFIRCCVRASVRAYVSILFTWSHIGN